MEVRAKLAFKICKVAVIIVTCLATVMGMNFVKKTDLTASAATAPKHQLPANFAGYLIFDDFFFLGGNQRDENTKIYNETLTGWRVDAPGGSVRNFPADGIRLSTTSEYGDVQVQKQFISQTNTELTLEVNFKLTTRMDGLTFQLLDGEIPVIKIGTVGGRLGSCDKDGNFEAFGTYAINKRISTKLVINLASQKFDFYLNGQLAKQNLSFFTDRHTVDSFLFKTSSTDIGNVFFEAVRLYRGYLVNEGLLGCAENTLPTGWVSMGGTASAKTSYTQSDRDTQSFYLDGAATTLSKGFAKQTAATTVDARFMLPTVPVSGAHDIMQLTNGGGNVITLGVNNGNIAYKINGGSYTNFTHANARGGTETMKAVANLWYSVKAEVKPANSIDLYINYKRVNITGLSANGVDGVKFTAVNAKLWTDSIAVYPTQAVAADYPTSPTKPSKPADSPRLGMQAYTGWKVGTHISYDPMYRFPEMDPYLGHFDYDNTEATDWQTKWMVERGVDFVMFDWYDNVGRAGKSASSRSALQEPMYNYATDAFFYSKYSGKENKLNFSIQVFPPYISLEDFRDYLIPYWCNYYFNDPHYEVIDNKPVIAIGYPGNLWHDSPNDGVNSMDDVKAIINMIRTACVNMGFDGAQIIATAWPTGFDNDADKDSLFNSNIAGYDGIYMYTYGLGAAHNVDTDSNLPTSFKNVMTNQQRRIEGKYGGAALTNLKTIIPTVCIGWNLTPNFPMKSQVEAGFASAESIQWLDTDSYFLVDKAKFPAHCEFVRDFSKSLPAGSLGRKMVLIDNWSEYTEGHSLNPSVYSGFDYIDAIGKAFTNATTFSHAKPTEAQKLRLNKDFPKPWNGGREWTFDSLYSEPEWWTKGDGILRYNTNKKGSLMATVDIKKGINEDKAFLQGPNNLAISSDAKKVMVRMKNGTDLSAAKIYFTTSSSNTWSEDKSMGFAVRPYDQYYSEYVVDMAENAKWTGNVTGLRLSFVSGGRDTSGDVLVDYIKVGIEGPKATPKIGQAMGNQVVPFGYEFLESADYYLNPNYIIDTNDPNKDTGKVTPLSSRSFTVEGQVKKADGSPLAKNKIAMNTVLTKSTMNNVGQFMFKNVKFGYHTIYVYDTNDKFLAKTSVLIKEGETTGFTADEITLARNVSKVSISMVMDGETLLLGDVEVTETLPPNGDTDQPGNTGENAEQPDDGSSGDGTSDDSSGPSGPENEKGKKGSVLWPIIGVGAAVLIGGGATGFVLFKKRKGAK